MNKKLIGSLSAFLVLTTLTTGCGTVTLKNGQKAAVTMEGSKISSDTYYKELCKKYGVNILVDMIDRELLNKKYKTDDAEKKEVEQQITQMKQIYGQDETQWKSVLQQYFGVNDEDELEDMLSLEYKRRQAVNDYLKDEIGDGEIDAYYNENIIGDIKAKHILINVETNDDMSDEDKEKADKEAKEKAKEIISKLKNGEDFAKLAEENSDDTGSAKDGGDLGYFNTDDNFDENFMAAAKDLEVGKFSEEPVKSQYGYHIILKEKQKKKPALKKVKDDVIKAIVEDKLSNDSSLFYKTLRDYREKNKVKFKDSLLKKEYKKYINNQIKNSTANSSNAE